MIIIFNSELAGEGNPIKHIKNLAFKRGASTEGEKKGLNYIKRELEKNNIEYKIDSFYWTNTFTFLMKSVFSIIIIFVLAYEIIILFPHITWIIIFLNLLLFISIFLVFRSLLNWESVIYLGKKKESKNLIATSQAKDLYRKRPVIIFSAHHDTKSSKYSVNLIKFLYISGGILFLAYIVITIILAICSLIALWDIFNINSIFLIIRNLIFIIGISLLLLFIIILFNKNKNESIGSLDNATGVAVLLELAKMIKKNPLERIDVIFLWCGAEEWGLCGSKNYCIEHFEELDYDYDLNKSYNINIDMIGSYLGLVDKTGLINKKEMNENINNIIKTTAKKMDIQIEPLIIPFGAGSDYMTFRAFARKFEKNRFQVCFFNSFKDGKYIHSIKDTPDKCSAKVLNNCIELCNNVIRSIDLRVD